MAILSTEIPISNIQSVLLKLLKRVEKINGSELARRLDLPAPTINRILSGQVTDPRSSTLILIADYFKISVDQLLGKAPLPLDDGDEFASLRPFRSVPIFTLNELTVNQQPTRWFQWDTDNISDYSKVFAVEIDTHKYAPEFSKETVLVVDPCAEPADNDFIIIQITPSSAPSIKRLVIEGNEKYLYPLQQELKVLALQDLQYRILGVILEAHLDFRN
ncbi:MAG: helix-turn-helix transcriptional regulator [Gammaproteobacteria bacterium]